MPQPSPFLQLKNGVQAAVRLTPKAARACAGGIVALPGGGVALKARVTAAPEKGKANAALLRLLAEAWEIPKSQMVIAAGESARNKLVRITGDPDVLMTQLCGWLGRVAKDHDG